MKYKKRLSSNLTFPYKYFVPILPVALAVWINLTIDKENNQGYFIPLNLLFLIIFLIPFSQLKNLKKVEYDKNNLIVSNFFKIKKYRLNDIIGVKRWFFLFYKISVKTNNKIVKIKFLSPANERMFRPFGKLNSIINFEKIIQKK